MKIKRTKRHIINPEKITDLSEIGLEKGDIWEINGNIEVITEVNYTEPGVISRINTLRRNEEGIIELGYDIDTNTKKLKEFFAGRHHKENVPPYIRSEQYSGLNEILRKAGL